MGELAYIHLQDMIPEESLDKWEKEKRNLTTLTELRSFFTNLIRDFKASGSKRKPERKGRLVGELAVGAEDLEDVLPANEGGLLFQLISLATEEEAARVLSPADLQTFVRWTETNVLAKAVFGGTGSALELEERAMEEQPPNLIVVKPNLPEAQLGPTLALAATSASVTSPATRSPSARSWTK